MRYNRQYVESIGQEALDFKGAGKGPERAYEIEVPDGFGEPPVEDICRAMDQSGDTGLVFADKVLLARHMILGRKVEVYYGGKLLFTAQTNKLTDSFDAFAWGEHPMALSLLLNVCEAHILKKYLPPRTATPSPQAAEAQGQRQRGSPSGAAGES